MLPQTFTPELMKRLELFQLSARRSFLGNRQGGHLSLRRGHGLEFSDYRQYEPGDNPRHIDWGLYGRTDRLYVKRFREETSLHLLLVVDGSSSVIAQPGDQKWERSRDIALALGYIASMSRDTISLLVPGIFSGPTVGGPNAVHHLAQQFRAITPGGLNNIDQSVARSLSELSTPGLVVVITDCLMAIDKLAALSQVIRSRSFDGTLVCVSGAHDSDPFPQNGGYELVDSEDSSSRRVFVDDELRRLYQERYTAHISSIKKLMISNQIHTCLNTDYNIGDFIAAELSKTGLVQ